jgi:hypothetical protein
MTPSVDVSEDEHAGPLVCYLVHEEHATRPSTIEPPTSEKKSLRVQDVAAVDRVV